MASSLFFSVGTIGMSTKGGHKPSSIVMAARHNMRASQNERGARAHINPARSHLNRHLRGPSSPEAVAALALSIMADAGVAVDKLRKDYTQAIELLFGLPADTLIDTGRYFESCVEWVERRFGAGRILCADVHHDEPAPHCHVLVLPLAEGRMVGASIVARAELVKMRDEFFLAVGRPFGLQKAARIDGAGRAALAAAVLDRLNASGDPAMRSAAWQEVRRAIERDPAPFAVALGVEVAKPSKRLRTMAEVFISKGKKTAEDRNLGFKAKKDRNLSCVGFAQSQAPIPPAELQNCEPQDREHGEVSATMTPSPSPSPSPAPGPAPRPRPRPAQPSPSVPDEGQTFARIRDDDMEANHWCEELGEWVESVGKPRLGRRAMADAWVAQALSGRVARWKEGRDV